MKIFIDLHHFDLYYSFQKLFEDRLGWELYRPIGYDWNKNGYWKINDIPIVKEGYLGTNLSEMLNKWDSFEGQEEWARYGLELLRVGKTVPCSEYGLYKVWDNSKDRYQYACTFNAFRGMKFDIIISTLPWHFPLYEKLIQTYQPQAKHIFQAGNIWDIPSDCKNLMCSTIPIGLNTDINIIKYHQEFDLETFSYEKSFSTNINSYIHFPESERLWEQVSSYLSFKYCFRFTGKTLGPIKDMIVKSKELGNRIKNSAFTWHIKPGGEGYGHILYNSFACGTPIITSFSDYKGMCGSELLMDGITSINIDNKTPSQIAKEIDCLTYNKEQYLKTRKRVRQQFLNCVNFDKEFIDISIFLKNLR